MSVLLCVADHFSNPDPHHRVNKHLLYTIGSLDLFSDHNCEILFTLFTIDMLVASMEPEWFSV